MKKKFEVGRTYFYDRVIWIDYNRVLYLTDLYCDITITYRHIDDNEVISIRITALMLVASFPWNFMFSETGNMFHLLVEKVFEKNILKEQKEQLMKTRFLNIFWTKKAMNLEFKKWIKKTLKNICYKHFKFGGSAATCLKMGGRSLKDFH